MLALLTGLFWFTGMLLPWDQLANWMFLWTRLDAQNALLAVYWTHVLFLSMLMLLLVIFYVRRTRRDHAAAA